MNAAGYAVKHEPLSLSLLSTSLSLSSLLELTAMESVDPRLLLPFIVRNNGPISRLIALIVSYWRKSVLEEFLDGSRFM